MNRAQAYGDGLFETMRIHCGRILHPEEHYFRLMSGMRILRMQIPSSWSPEGWLQALELDKLDPRVDHRLRLTVWRKGGMGYAPEPESGVDWAIEASALDGIGYPIPVNRPVLGLFQEHRKNSGLLANLKTTSAVLYVLAAGFSREQGVDDVLLLNPENQVIEAGKSNVMLLQGDTLITPPLSSGALKGVMREVVIGLSSKLGLSVREEAFSPFTLQQSDELWLTNALQGVSAVRQFRKTEFGCAKAELMQALVQERAETAQFQ